MSDVAPAPVAPEATPAPVAPVVPEVTAEAPPEKTFTQKELDEILEKRLAKERRKREEQKRENEVLRKLALERDQRQPQEDKKPQPTEGEPKREQFDSYEAYVEARAEWKAERAVEKKLRDREEKEAEARTARERKEQADAFQKRVKEHAKSIDDFDDVMADVRNDPEHPVARLYAPPISETENPAQIIYHLAKNPEEAERIASLPESKQAREIWALEQKLKSAPQKTPSKAPAPIKPVGGSTVGSEMPSDSDSTEDWMRKENLRLRKSKT